MNWCPIFIKQDGYFTLTNGEELVKIMDDDKDRYGPEKSAYARSRFLEIEKAFLNFVADEGELVKINMEEKEKSKMKYKVGDKVRIVSERTGGFTSSGSMDCWLGKVMTISEAGIGYEMEEDGGEWHWRENMIAGLADETEEGKVNIEFTREEIEYVAGDDSNIEMRDRIILRFRKVLAELDTPKIGDRCAFWDDDSRIYKVGVLTDTKHASNYKYIAENDEDFKHCAKIKKEAEF